MKRKKGSGSDCNPRAVDMVIDVPFSTVENDLPRIFEQEEDMATQPERIATLEQDKKWHWWALGALATWLAWMSVFVIGMKGDLQAIKQKIKDGGVGEIVSQIQNPASPEQLDAALKLVSSQIAVQQANKVKPDQQKLSKLGTAVRAAALTAPNNPAVWQTGAELVNYRYQPQLDSTLSGTLPNCLDGATTALNQIRNTPESLPGLYMIQASRCSLDLDASANPSFLETDAAKFFAEANRRNPKAGNVFLLKNAVVIYSGGQTIPINTIHCQNCVFRLPVSDTVPAKAGQFLTDQLLISDLNNTTVTLPQGM